MIGNTVLEIESKIENILQKRQAIQPFIIITKSVTHPEEILVYFDGIKFKFFSILQAIDTCFKIFHLFNLEYPAASSLVWQFIQKYFYKMNLISDKNHPSITYLISQMKENNK